MDTDPTPLDRFVSDGHKRAALKAILENPVLAEAMSIVDDTMRPKCNTAADSNQPLSIAKFHQSAGVSHFISTLRTLTREPVARVKVEPRKLATTLEDLPKTDSE